MKIVLLHGAAAATVANVVETAAPDVIVADTVADDAAVDTTPAPAAAIQTESQVEQTTQLVAGEIDGSLARALFCIDATIEKRVDVHRSIFQIIHA